MFWAMVGCSFGAFQYGFTAHCNCLCVVEWHMGIWVLWSCGYTVSVNRMLFHCISCLGGFIVGISCLVRSAFYFAMTQSKPET